MKNIKVVATLFIIILILMLFSSSVFAGKISSINANTSDKKITVSGKTESGVLAVAILVYSGNDLIYMETSNIDNNLEYSCKLNKTFDDGTYTVKVADYNGGDYKTTSIEVKQETTTKNEKDETPKTGNNYFIETTIIIFSSLVYAIILIKKINNR